MRRVSSKFVCTEDQGRGLGSQVTIRSRLMDVGAESTTILAAACSSCYGLGKEDVAKR